jgi:L-fucose mutarotase/ribose pyranase (RbsD/FucU family)
MELTVISKKRYDELTQAITAMQEQLTAMQNSNNQLAEIAFDENKFTQELLERCEHAAEVAARDAVDVDEIANEVAEQIDIDSEVERYVDRMDLVTGDDVQDHIRDYISDEDMLNRNEIDELIQESLEDFKASIINEVINAITSKLTAKENHHANNDRDTSIQVSGVNGHSQTESNGTLNT